MIELGLGADVIRGIRDFIRMHIFNTGDKATVSKGLSAVAVLYSQTASLEPNGGSHALCLRSNELFFMEATCSN